MQIPIWERAPSNNPLKTENEEKDKKKEILARAESGGGVVGADEERGGEGAEGEGEAADVEGHWWWPGEMRRLRLRRGHRYLPLRGKERGEMRRFVTLRLYRADVFGMGCTLAPNLRGRIRFSVSPEC